MEWMESWSPFCLPGTSQTELWVSLPGNCSVSPSSLHFIRCLQLPASKKVFSGHKGSHSYAYSSNHRSEEITLFFGVYPMTHLISTQPEQLLLEHRKPGLQAHFAFVVIVHFSAYTCWHDWHSSHLSKLLNVSEKNPSAQGLQVVFLPWEQKSVK